jgi:hypothetical protein
VARVSKAEPNLKDYVKKYQTAEGDQVPWASASVMGGVIHVDRITVRSDVGEFSLSESRESLGTGERIKIGQILWLESVRSVWAEESGSEWKFRQGLEIKFSEVGRRVDGRIAHPESPSCLRNSRTPLVSHRSQIHRSFLPRRQKLQEEIEVLETVSIGNNVHHSCRQVSENFF